MQIRPVQNYQYEYKNKPNFEGEIIIPDKMTKLGKEFLDENIEYLKKLVQKESYDVFIKELPEREHTTPVVFAVNKGVKPNPFVCLFLCETVDKFVQKKELEAIKQEFEKQNFDIKKITEEIMFIKEQKTPEPKPYVPRKIGTPQRPHIKRKKHY